jgi:hypothetical protein
MEICFINSTSRNSKSSQPNPATQHFNQRQEYSTPCEDHSPEVVFPMRDVIVTVVDEMEIDAKQERPGHGPHQEIQRVPLLLSNGEERQDQQRSDDNYNPDKDILPEFEIDAQFPMGGAVDEHHGQMDKNDHCRMRDQIVHDYLRLRLKVLGRRSNSSGSTSGTVRKAARNFLRLPHLARPSKYFSVITDANF